MNREIKFRIFNPHIKNLMYDIENVYDWLKQQIAFNKTQPTRGFTIPFDHVSEGLVWMQYTGLKDKNGVEVYEGDIVQLSVGHPDVLKNRYKVRMKQWSYVLEDVRQTDKAFYGFMPFNSINKSLEANGIYHLEIEHILEVIGNIYQHPELLAEPINPTLNA